MAHHQGHDALARIDRCGARDLDRALNQLRLAGHNPRAVSGLCGDRQCFRRGDQRADGRHRVLRVQHRIKRHGAVRRLFAE
jgi:hypothetical protein